jgi:hypothetical protein
VREQVSYDDHCEPLRHPDEIIRSLGVFHERQRQQLPALQSRIGRILASPVAIPGWKPSGLPTRHLPTTKACYLPVQIGR